MKEKSETEGAHKKFNFKGEKIQFFPSIGLKVTNVCRFNCPFCCEPNRSIKDFDIENFLNITKLLRESGTQRLCLTGGDPLHYPHLVQLLEYTKAIGFYNLLLTSDGALLNKKIQYIMPFLDAVRISIHDLGEKHDKIVKHKGAFEAIEAAVDNLLKVSVPCFVTTVITSLNLQYLSDIAEWCYGKNVEQLFLFGLMRSGKGDEFFKKHGGVPKEEISQIVFDLKRKYEDKGMEIIHYEYNNNAECILVYGDGKVVIDPYPDHPSFQLEIGNILNEDTNKILGRFFEDPENYIGYCKHLEKYNKAQS